ncbi:MAG: hypothetical protein IIA05_00345 [Proteobacteria bacterium]|nr:hypothetical protein [Pseudomonadota bacterium]
MKTKLIVFLLAILGSFCTFAGDWADDISPQTALKAIQLFRDDPVSEDALAAVAIVLNFAERSDDVLVLIDAKYLPFELGAIESDANSKFLGAYVAGNVEYQLLNSVRENRPMEGIRFMLQTYEKFRQADAIEVQSGFEEWLELERKGQLGDAFET